MENQSDTEKAHLYDDYMEAQHKKALAKRYVGKIPSYQLQLGLQITLTSCKEKDLGEVEVILCKQDRDDDAISCKKTRDKIVKSLKMKITAGNLSHVLTSVDANEHDIAADLAVYTQEHPPFLHSIRHDIINYDPSRRRPLQASTCC
jgi:hypothetical protein